MAFFSWTRWFRSILRPQVKPIRKRSSTLRLEELETRLAPATFTWDGLGANANWSTGANWVGGIAPSGSAATLDNLVFQGANQLATNNNLTGATFNSITFSSANFTLSGNAITLGSTAASGSGGISVNSGLIGETIALNITLGGAGISGQQVFTINPAAVLTIGTAAGGTLSGPAGIGLTEQGGGTLILGQSNSAFLGPFTVASGSVVEITNSNALGITNTTTIQQNAQLQLDNVGTVSEDLKVSGPGVNNQGVIISTGLAGSNDTLTGTVEIDSPVTFGGSANTTLTFNGSPGQITDLGAGYAITKEGANTIVFATSNNYRGQTTINNGVLEVENSGAVGVNRVTINTTLLETGTLALNDPSGTDTAPITLSSQILPAGTGFAGDGAIWNMAGNNTLTGQISLQSTNVGIRTDDSGILEAPDFLTISGLINNGGSANDGLTKIGTIGGTGSGTLILTDSNTYTGGTNIQAGILDITDSQALGPKATAGLATVADGATLELDVDGKADSLTGTTNTLTVFTPLHISGVGTGGQGALYSATGINVYSGQITLVASGTDDAGIGVDPDPNQVNGPGYFTSEYSLTLSTAGGTGPLVGTGVTIAKVGLGQLILPQANTGFTGNNTNPEPGNIAWDIQQGWVTIENSQSLGAMVANTSQNNQMVVAVEANASLQLKALPGQNLNIDQNLQLSGQGISHPFALLNEGALENISGVNTLDGNVVLEGQVGVGVENVFGQPSQLTTVGTISQLPDKIAINASSGTEKQQVIPVKVGANGSTGAITLVIQSNVKPAPDDLRVYLGGNGTLTATGQTIPGVTGVLIYDNSLTPYPVAGWGTPNNKFPQNEATITISYTNTTATLLGVVEAQFNTSNPAGTEYNPNFVNGSTTITYPALTSTNDEIVMNQVVNGVGNKDGSVGWTEGITATPPNVPGGLVKLGSQLLDIQGAGTYQGGIDIQQGVVINQNDTGLGAAGGTATVESGAALALANGTPYNNGGLQSGITVANTHLVINGSPEVQAITLGGATTGTFQVTFNGQTTAALSASIPASGGTGSTASLQNALNALSSIGGVGGSVAVTLSGGVYTVTFGGTLANFNQAPMTVAAAGGTTASVSTITSGLGNTTLGVPLAPFSVLSSDTSVWSPSVTLVQSSPFLQTLAPIGSNTIVPSDDVWNGPVSLNVSTPIDVAPGSRLQITGTIGDTANPSANGSDLIAMDSGELVLAGANTYNGTTYVGTNATAGSPGDDPDAVNEFFNPSSPVALGDAVLTVANSQGLGGTTNGVIVQGSSALQLEGNITISGKTLTVQGSGVSAAGGVGSIENWTEVGPAPISGGQTLGSPAAVSGMVTDIVVDPTDTNTIYLSTDGGGVWKSTDGGTTWLPIFDNTATTSNMFVGSIAVSPSNPQVVYIGTGVANGPYSIDGYAGDGIYESTDGGHSWALVTGPAAEVGGANPLIGLSVSKIVVDPQNSSLIYVATGNQGINGSIATHGSSTAVAGIWRFESGAWLNLTAQISPNRKNVVGATQATAPGNPGPDDNYLYSFPQTNVTWSDLLLVGSGATATLFAALGTPGGSMVTNYGTTVNANFVYFSTNPTAAGSAIVWDMGNGVTDKETDKIDAGDALVLTAGNIKLTATQFNGGGESFGLNAAGKTNFIVYAAIADDGSVPANAGTLDGVWQGVVVAGGGGSLPAGDQFNWTAVPPGAPASNPDTQDDYDLAIYTAPNGGGTNVYVGTQNHFLWTSTSGGAWTDITVDANKNAPHADFLALTGYTVGPVATPTASAVLAGTDGGIWSLNTLSNANTWSDLNTDLAISQINSVSENSTSPTASYVATQASGVDQNSADSTTWTMATDNAGASPFGAGVVVDPNNPNNIYAFVTNLEIPNAVGTVSTLMMSSNGGTSFSPTGYKIAMQVPALAIDSVVSSRQVVSNAVGGVAELTDGVFLRNLPAVGAGIGVTSIGLAEYQGPFVADPSFSSVTDQGANAYVPGTIYVTNGISIYVTKNYGTTWVNRSIPAVTTSIISQIVVDPLNENIVYVVTAQGAGTGSGHVYKSIDGGQNWVDITGNLPDLATWSIVIDPRTNTLYVGNDNGVWGLIGGGGQWQRIGSGMPSVQVRSLYLDLATNTLFAGTYGRSEFSILLNGTQANGGAFTVVSGSAFWTGPINLSGATTIGADGGITYQRNGIDTATLTISGVITDLNPATGASDQITKIGFGNVVLSGANTYLGVTDIQQGVLIVDNPQALGATSAGTIVEAGTALQMEQSIIGEPLTLNGNGPAAGFDGHFTGALESLSNALTYSGDITLGSNVTIGVDSGSTLTITGNISDGGNGFGVTKELTGTLAFEPATANTYMGSTYVSQGVLLIEGSEALADSTGTFVLDGAQLQLMSPNGVTPVIITGETLDLTGAGISGTGSEGALLNVSGDNAWDGPVTLDYNPGFSPTTFPVGAGATEPAGAAIGVLNAGDVLTIGGSIGEATGLPSQLVKVGAGTLALDAANTYSGETIITGGAITVQNAQALGNVTPTVNHLYAIDRSTLLSPNGTGTMTYDLYGQATPSVTIGVSAATLQGYLNTILANEFGSNALANVTVTKTTVTVPLLAGTPTPSFTEVVFSFLFGGTAMAGLNTPIISGTETGGLIHNETQVANGGYGVSVASGSALNLDLAASTNGQTVAGEPVHISGAGTGVNQEGAIDNLSGNNTWADTVTLDNGSSIGVNGGSLTVQGDVAGTPTSQLTKIGTGTLFFPNANDYGGTTDIQSGVLNIANADALGLPNEVQTLDITSSTGTIGGTFKLAFTYHGTTLTTGFLAADITGAALQTAIDGILPTGGTVTVLKQATYTDNTIHAGNHYTITFGGTLAGQNLNQLTVPATTSPAIGTVATVTNGGPLTNEVDAVTINGATTGTFTLTFQGQTTGNLAANDPNLVADMTAALNGLSTIGGVGGSVTVAQTVNVYNVAFGGTLAGQNLDGDLRATVTSGAGTSVVVTETTPGGLGGTVVENGGTLQLQNSITVSTEQLQLAGPGYNGMGALDSLSGANTWANPITLNASSSIGVDADSGSTPGLTINQVISGPAAGTNLTKVGVATLELTATNTYNGATFVDNGTLLLDDNGGQAIPGDLTVGDGIGAADSAVALPVFSNELVNTANLTVNSDGEFNLNSLSQTFNSVTIVDGTVLTGNTGTLTTGSLAMTGGDLNTGTAGQVNLNGNVTATSDAATGAAIIGGSGSLTLGSAATFDVTAGPATSPAVDLDVEVPITSAGEGILKTGNGRLELDAINAYGLTTINAGDVQVDGTVGDVLLNGGSVSGTGTDLTNGQVDNIGGPGGAVPNGTISPGDNGTTNPIGTLTVSPESGTETWGKTTTFAVDLNDATAAPGIGNDLLFVNGNLNLGGTQIAGGNNGGAILSGTVSANVNVGDSFTIIETTGTITGVFQEPFANNTVFIGGDKFTVAYNAQSVVLTRAINSATLAVVSSANPAVYGQDVQFTATLTGQQGANAPFQPTDQVTFTLQTPSAGTIVDVETVVNGKATFDALANGPLPPGTYVLDVSFAGDPNYGPASVTGFQEIINQAVTTTTLAPSPTVPVYGQPLVITATVAPKSPGAGIPTGTVTFFIDGGNANSANGGSQQTVTFDPTFGGVVPLPLNGLSVGTHSFTASYSGDTNFKASNTALPALSVTVAKDADTMQLTASPANSAVVGAQVTFTAAVTTNGPGTAVPTGTVNFFDGATQIGTGSLAFDASTGNYDVSMQIATLTIGGHTITAKYLGNADELANQVVASYTITQVGTTTSIASSTGSNPAVYGQSVTFTATVASVAPGTGIPTGTVTFTNGSVVIQTVSVNASGVASVSTTGLAAGSHTITATYNGATSYAGSNASLTQTVEFASATSLTSSANPSVSGASVTFTAKVVPGVGMPAGTPSGQVDFVIDNGASQSGPLTLSGGQITYTVSNLTSGTHSVVAEYLGGATYGSSSSPTLTQNVVSGSTVSLALAGGTNPSTVGQILTFQATVAATALGAQTPTGTVTFFDGTTNLGTETLVSGVATISLSNLAAGTHSISASYGGDSGTAASKTTTPLTQLVTEATPTATVNSSVDPSSLGQSVTFTTDVTTSGNPVISGNVTFLIDGGSANAAHGGFQYTTALTDGQATYTVTALSKGSHTVVVDFNDPAGNYTSVNSPTLTQTVLFGTTISALTSSANPAAVNSPVTLTAAVSTNDSGTVTGSVDFFDTTTNTDLGSGTITAGTGTASIATSFSTLGTNAITATYSGDSNFNTSTATLNEQVLASVDVGLLQTSGNNPSVYTEPVTFQATVTPQSGGGPTPTGSVSFYSGTVLLTTVNLASGSSQVTATVNNIPAGADNITATYNGDSNYASGVSPVVTQNVNVDPTTTAVASSAPSSVFGETVAFTATVAATGNATGVPTGTVTFMFNGGAANSTNGGFQDTATLSSGQASYSTSTLTPSPTPYSVQAVYNGNPNGFSTSTGTLAGGQTVSNPSNSAFSYDAATKTLTVTGTNFTFSQITTEDAGGNLHSTYFFTMDGTTESFPDTEVSHAVIDGNGTAGSAILITNNTYVNNQGVAEGTQETISLGSMSNAGTGTMLKYNDGTPYTFLTLKNFPISYAYAGRNDGTVSLYGTAGVAYNGFVSDGNYAYMGGPGLYHEAQGAASVYGYSSGQATDFAYHYAGNPGSQFVVSGVAYSYMSGTDQNPDANNATQSFFNVGVGFLLNTGVSKNPGQDYAYFIDSPGNDTFIGGSSYSYMYIQNSDGSFAEFDAAYGFALIYAQSFVGGTDTAVNNDPSINILTGFNIESGSGRSGS